MNRMQLTEVQPRLQGRIPYGAVAMAVILAVAAVAGSLMLLNQPSVGPIVLPSNTPVPTAAAPTSSPAPSASPAPTGTSTPSAVSPVTPAPQVGLGWQRVTDADILAGPHGTMHGVIAGGPGAIAWGEVYATGPRIWYTTDGLDWTKATVETPTDFAVEQKDPGAVLDVVAGGPGYVAVGAYSRSQVKETDTGTVSDIVQTALIWTSSDGKTWQRVPDDPVFADAFLGQVIAWKGQLLAYGCAGCGMESGPTTGWASTDGVSWTRFTPTLPEGNEVLDGVTVTADGLRATGGMAPRSGDPNPQKERPSLTSVDGRTWTISGQPIAPASGDNVVAVGDTVIRVGATPDGCSSSGTCGAAAWRSTDGGQTWTSVPVTGTLPAGVTASTMTAAAALDDGTIVAVGTDLAGGEPTTAAWVAPAQE